MKTLLILSSLSLALILTDCGGSKGGNPSPQQPPKVAIQPVNTPVPANPNANSVPVIAAAPASNTTSANNSSANNSTSNPPQNSNTGQSGGSDSPVVVLFPSAEEVYNRKFSIGQQPDPTVQNQTPTTSKMFQTIPLGQSAKVAATTLQLQQTQPAQQSAGASARPAPVPQSNSQAPQWNIRVEKPHPIPPDATASLVVTPDSAKKTAPPAVSISAVPSGTAGTPTMLANGGVSGVPESSANGPVPIIAPPPAPAAGPNTSTDLPENPNLNADLDKPLAQIPTGLLYFKTVSPAAFKQLITEGGTRIQGDIPLVAEPQSQNSNPKAKQFTSATVLEDPKKPYCGLARDTGAQVYELLPGQDFRDAWTVAPPPTKTLSYVFIYLRNMPFVIECEKYNFDPFTGREIADALKGAFKVTVLTPADLEALNKKEKKHKH